MKVVWCKKRTSLFVVACVVFLGGNVLLLSSLSWPFFNSRSEEPAKFVRFSDFEKRVKADLLDNFEPKDHNVVLVADSTGKQVGKNDVEQTQEPTTEKANNLREAHLLGNRGDLENNMFRKDPVTTAVSNEKTQHEVRETAAQAHSKPPSHKTETRHEYIIAVLLISCNRPAAVSRSLDQLLKHRPSARTFPIIVSQDCGDEQTAKTIQDYGEKIMHIKQPDLSNIPVQPPMARYQGYFKIARHYKWALTQIFDVMKYDSVIIVEDDLDIAPDFFEYFKATRPLLDQDPTIWCVSAWNDNGKKGYVQGQDILYRTDFFPGLGWMLTKSLWNELGPKWPRGFWDDWMREPDQRRDRACIRPEVSRTKTFGKIGVSMGQFYNTYLRFIHLNDKPYPFSKIDLSYLHKSNFDKHFLAKVYKAPQVDLDRIQNADLRGSTSWIIEYSDQAQFVRIAKALGIMDDFKAGVPRTAYQGVVSTLYKGARIYIAPPYGTWAGYKP